ncbi:hypothetical protein [Ectobacillus funiculus]|uniref:hypothetical protein n=1 Tax=Ectobacillus funiculus TaxID=137993 RepID=UPI00101CD313|nr:hypothetical protein [Ectobacillus funiculus]
MKDMSKCQDRLDMSVYTVYEPEETQMRVTLSAASSLTDIECAMHLPEGVILRSSSIPPAKVEEETVTWTNPNVSRWEVAVTPSSETIRFTATGRIGNERVLVERVVQGGEKFVLAQLIVCNQSRKVSSYQPGDVLEIEIRLRNCGTVDVVQLFGSHMIRDYLSYIPDTLQTDKGEGAVVFRLVRWRIPLLQPGEEAVLAFQTRAQEGNPHDHITIGATYTFQARSMMYGPYETERVLLSKE